MADLPNFIKPKEYSSLIDLMIAFADNNKFYFAADEYSDAAYNDKFWPIVNYLWFPIQFPKNGDSYQQIKRRLSWSRSHRFGDNGQIWFKNIFGVWQKSNIVITQYTELVKDTDIALDTDNQ